MEVVINIEDCFTLEFLLLLLVLVTLAFGYSQL